MSKPTLIAIVVIGLLMAVTIFIFGGEWHKYLILLAVFMIGVFAEKLVGDKKL